MEKIDNVTTEPLGSSKFIKPHRMHYTQDGEEKIWDLIKAHDSVSILMHNTTRNKFIIVKQFRPAVYLKLVEDAEGKEVSKVNSTKYDGSIGITHELCAGIVDKDVSLKELARLEMLEETGYDVPEDCIEKIASYRSVGKSSTVANIFYARVIDDMKTHAEGGNSEEGEFIELDEIDVDKSLEYALDDSIIKPVAMAFAIFWFHQFKKNKCDNSP